MGREKLKREIAREALARLEEAARTKKDFEIVIETWNRLDANRERKERLYEVGRSAVPLEWGVSADNMAAASSSSVTWREMLKGNFFDMIYDCPEEIHQLVEDADVSALLERLSERHKEFLYQYAVCLRSCEEIAKVNGQTDRNIRKIRARLLNKLREGLLERLRLKERGEQPLTQNEKRFLQENRKGAPNDCNVDNMKYENTNYRNEAEVNHDRSV